MSRSEFKLTSMLRRLGEALQLMDQSGFPRKVNMNEWVPTIGMDLGMSAYNPVFAAATVVTGVAQGSVIWPIVSPINLPFPLGLQQFPNNLNLETVILGYSLRVTMSGVAGTENNHWVNVRRQRGTDPSISNNVDVSIQQRWGYYDFAAGKTVVDVTNGPNQQQSDLAVINSHSADSPIWVPAGRGFQIVLELDPIANFSAGIAVAAQAFGIQCPAGVRPPFV